MDYREITVERCAEGIALVCLNRPERLNAYTPDMGDELVHALRAAAADRTVHAVVLTGNGRAFCAGADREFLGGRRARSGLRLGEEHFIAGFAAELAALPVLTIAAMQGAAAGIGVTMTLPFDLRIVARDAPLVLNFAELGIVPGLGSTHYLPQLVGLGRALELLLVTRRIDGAGAAAIGLAQRAVAREDVLAEAMAAACAVAGCPRAALLEIRQALRAGAQSTLEAALAAERAAAARLRTNNQND